MAIVICVSESHTIGVLRDAWYSVNISDVVSIQSSPPACHVIGVAVSGAPNAIGVLNRVTGWMLIEPGGPLPVNVVTSVVDPLDCCPLPFSPHPHTCPVLSKIHVVLVLAAICVTVTPDGVRSVKVVTLVVVPLDCWP